MCTALLAAPSQHPAVDALIRELPASLVTHSAATPNVASGPEFATALWREREDVRRLPPMAFYPVGWWEKQLLGTFEYPKETYAVHHWAKGWGKTTPKKIAPTQPSEAKVSILVPFRDVEGDRSELWAFVRERLELEMPEAEIVVASDDGDLPFHKTLALNRAAAEATGDVFVIFDADTFVDTDVMRALVAQVAARPDIWGQPYRTKIKLNEATTRMILDAGPAWHEAIDLRAHGQQESRTTFWAAPPLVLHREAWNTVGGTDERFLGWGQEDVAFATALNVLVGGPLRQRKGDALHLNHSRQGVSGNDSWLGQTEEQKKANIWLNGRYRAARTAEKMRALLEERMVAV